MNTTHDTLDQWLESHVGLSLDHFPEVRSQRLRAFMADVPQEAWDTQLNEVARLLSIPETHFARHPECFDALHVLLQEIESRRPAGTIRLWSAGCATGEEAYQLAAVGRSVVGERIRVMGTDFSSSAVALARQGTYRSWSMRGSAARSLSWLTAHPDGSFEVDPALKPLVQFGVGNLADPAVAPDRVDVAFCRNVLIYFSEDGGDRVLENIFNGLRPGGYLIVAPTDPAFPALERFAVVHHEGPPVRIYQRPQPSLRDQRPAAHGARSAGSTTRSASQERSAPEARPQEAAPWAGVDVAEAVRKLLGS